MKKLLTKTFVTLAFVLTGLLIVAYSDDQEVSLESKESRTVEGGAVFNRIQFFQTAGRDVWMMNQSHHGSRGLGADSWDRLAIVVDTTVKPKRARFYQLEPGPLQWRDDLPEKPMRVSCYMCHNNGPRVIRPNYDSPLNTTSFLERIKIASWNLRIKTYGRVVPDDLHAQRDSTTKHPFRFYSKYESETLKVKTCAICHKEAGLFARGALSRQQLPTIQFMLESGEMPPPGFKLSSVETAELERYLEGF